MTSHLRYRVLVVLVEDGRRRLAIVGNQVENIAEERKYCVCFLYNGSVGSRLQCDDRRNCSHTYALDVAMLT